MDLADLVPWSADRPPKVVGRGPGYDDYGNGCDELFDFPTDATLARATSLADKMAALKRIAARLAPALEPGDFVVMSYGSRQNASLVGWIVGRGGALVSTHALPAVNVEYTSPRMVIPAHLVPADANPARLFRALLAHSKYYATAVVALPPDSALLRSLGLRPVPDHTHVFVTMDADMAACVSPTQAVGDPVSNLLKRSLYTPGGPIGFYCISLVPDALMTSSFWECGSDDFGLGGEVVFASHDSTTWVGRHSKNVTWTVTYASPATEVDSSEAEKARVMARTRAFKAELRERVAV